MRQARASCRTDTSPVVVKERDAPNVTDLCGEDEFTVVASNPERIRKVGSIETYCGFRAGVECNCVYMFACVSRFFFFRLFPFKLELVICLTIVIGDVCTKGNG